jgi:spermidine synthase
LSKNGILVTQNGVPFFQRNELLNSANLLSQNFKDVAFYLAPIPTYQGGKMAFGWASNSRLLPNTTQDKLNERFREAAIVTSYYTPEIHLSSSVLPKWISQLLTTCNPEHTNE